METILGHNKTLGPAPLRVDHDGNLCTVGPSSGLPYQKFLNHDGLGTFLNNNHDHSAAPIDHYYTATSRYDIATVLISVSDVGKFGQSTFGAMAALTNGINFWVSPDLGVTKIPLLSNIYVKENKDWYYISHHIALTDFDSTAQTMSILLSIKELYGKTLDLEAGSSFGVTLNDNFTGLTALTFQTRGVLYI